VIIIEPQGGLANRMRVIASGLWLKEKLGTKLSVIWNENYELNCPFNLLFEDPDMFAIKPKEQKHNYLKTSNQPGFISNIKAAISNKLLGIDYCLQEVDVTFKVCTGEMDIYQETKKHGTSYIQTCQEFGDILPYLKFFKPVAPINETINVVAKGFDKNTVGVHVRRSDHTNAIALSPLTLFIEKLQAALDKHNNTSFFLCTDDDEVEQHLTNVFGDKIISYKKERSRQTIKGMQDAMVDMYCLAQTKKILGSYWSSFAEVAAKLGNIELEVLKISN